MMTAIAGGVTMPPANGLVPEIQPPKLSLYEQLVNATGNTTITVTEDMLFEGVTISNPSSIFLRGDSAERTIFNDPTSNYSIIVERGVTLTLENITLKGIRAVVNEGGSLIMNNASAITGCNHSGVFVTGIFIMNGGSITNNSISLSGGGGVRIERSGSFTLNNGIIAFNKSTDSFYGGGGVCVRNNGKFTMINGRIENNVEDTGRGGGVYIDGKFFMQGGVISGNRAGSSGGGVYVSKWGAIFNMTSGTVYGSNDGSNSNTASRGAAVYDENKLIKIQNKTIYRY